MSYLVNLATVILTSPLPATKDDLVARIMYVVFGALGGVSLIIIVWAGMKYTLSAGDSSKTAEAKNQILYAVIGVVVAISASAIVGYVTRTKL